MRPDTPMVRRSAAARARTAAGSRGEEREEASVDGVGSGGLELLADRGWSARGSGTEGEAAKVGISLEAMTVARRESPTRQGIQEAGRRVLSPRLASPVTVAVVTVPRNGKTTRPTRHVDDELVVMFSSAQLRNGTPARPAAYHEFHDGDSACPFNGGGGSPPFRLLPFVLLLSLSPSIQSHLKKNESNQISPRVGR